RVIYGNVDDDPGVTIDFSLPMRPWDYPSYDIGGHDETAAGVPVVFLVRRDRRAVLRLRIQESEEASVRAWLEWARGGSNRSFTIRFDQDIAADYTCYLVRPAPTDPIVFTWVEDTRIKEIEIEIRQTSGAAFTEVYFD